MRERTFYMKIKHCFFMTSVCLFMGIFIIPCRCVSPNDKQQKPILENISIHFNQSTASFTLAQAQAGVHIGYTIAISEDVDTIYSIDMASCNSPDSTGLIPFEVLHGNGQAYCLCDNGFCPYKPEGDLSSLNHGIYPRSFAWHGRNWQGRSDTNNPLGEPFPAGAYMLNVCVKGRSLVNGSYQEFLVSDSIPVILTN
jgi:hypothetical protein